jgi:hypothetical protein
MPTIATVIKTSISENPRCCRVAFCVFTLSRGPGSPHTIEWNAYKIRQILPRRSRSIFSRPLQLYATYRFASSAPAGYTAPPHCVIY